MTRSNNKVPDLNMTQLRFLKNSKAISDRIIPVMKQPVYVKDKYAISKNKSIANSIHKYSQKKRSAVL